MTNAEINALNPAIITHYESLRAAALGDALPPEARAGLMLLSPCRHVVLGTNAGRYEYVRVADRLPTIELEGADGTQNRNPPLCSHGNPNAISGAIT